MVAVTTPPFTKGQCVCPKWAIEAAERLDRSWLAFCETVETCFERDGRWMITLLASRGESAADDWSLIKVEMEGEKEGRRGLWFSCSVATPFALADAPTPQE